jgi:hypothetical protein
MRRSKALVYGGYAAGAVMIVLGLASIIMGFNGRDEVRDNLAKENIVGTPDMEGIAGEQVDTGSEARKFAEGMRKHALEATDGQTYAEMARFLDEDGNPTEDEKAAAIDADTGEPVENGARNIWVTETALSTALNVSYFAEQVANFALAIGIALLLAGIGFLILARFGLRPDLE